MTPLSLGVETAGGVFTRLIERNTTVPTQATEIFSTARDNQDFVNVHVLQGEREMAEDNKSLANFELVGIPPAMRGVPKIEVTFDIDANGILTVSAKDLGSGTEQTVNAVSSTGLSEHDFGRLVEEAESAAEADRAVKSLVEVKNRATSLLYTTERALSEYAESLPEGDRTELAADVEACKNLMEGRVRRGPVIGSRETRGVGAANW